MQGVEALELVKENFWHRGFAPLPGLLPSEVCGQMLAAFEQLKQGIYETHVYPDQWLQQPVKDGNSFLFVSNAWKANNTVARLVLSQKLGETVSQITGWDGVRLAMDSMLWKPPGGREVNFHQDSAYMRCFSPDDSITVWIPLDNVQANMGALEYCVGSHKWPAAQDLANSGVPEDYRSTVKDIARQLDMPEPEFEEVLVDAGTAMFHHGSIWHGSGINQTDIPRRSIAIHFVKENTQFNDAEYGFIFRRYQMMNSQTLNEAFFPLVYTTRGYRTMIERAMDSLI